MSRKKNTAERREKGTGYLILRNGIYQARWTRHGKKFNRSTKTGDKKEALRLLSLWTEDFRTEDDVKVIQRMADQIDTTRRNAGVLPLASMWEEFSTSLKRKACAPLTDKVYRARINAFVSWMRENHPTLRTMRDVADSVAVDYMKHIKATKSNKTYNDTKCLLSQAWDILPGDAAALENPWKKIPGLERETHVRRELTVEELARVIAPLEGEERVLFAVGIYTGLRLGDCCNLKWSSIDLARGFIQLVPRKTERHKTVVKIPVAGTLRNILTETPPEQRTGFVMPGLQAKHASYPQGLCNRVKRIFENAGIRTTVETDRQNPGTKKKRLAVEVGFHSLRHTFVSICANEGVPMSIVQAIVGHTNAAMTAHYFHVADDALLKAAQALPALGPADAPAPARLGQSEALTRAQEAVAALTPEEKAVIRRMLDEEAAA